MHDSKEVPLPPLYSDLGYLLKQSTPSNPRSTLVRTLDLEREHRKGILETLREVDQRFRLAFDHAPIGMALVARDGQFLQVNPSYCELVGYTGEELRTLTFQAITHPDDLDRDVTHAQKLLAGEIERYSMEKRYIHKRGHVVWVLLHVSVVLADDRQPLYFVSQVKDITERKRADEERERLLLEVSSARERLEVLSRRLVHLQEEERRTIARELHDEVGQILTGLKLMIETAERGAGTADPRPIKEAVALLLERVHDLSLNLRPPMLDDLGLVPTLLWHFERYRAHTGIAVHFHHFGVAERFPARTEITAFRLVQEGLTNVARHSGVSEVSVEVSRDGDHLRLRIEDAGRGFEASDLGGAACGLTGMRERAMLAGGTLTIESRPGHGTRISAELPLNGSGGRA
jgi:PAS domain S-box-containing protein